MGGYSKVHECDIVAGLRKCFKCRDLVGEGKVFIKDKAKVATRVGCSERSRVF